MAGRTSRCDRVGAVGKADANGLVDVQHVCILVEAVWVDCVLAPFTKWQGPFSWKRPIMLEHPGPLLNHAAGGAVVGLLRAPKNLTMFSITLCSKNLVSRTRTTCSYLSPRTDSQSTGSLPEFVTNSSFAPVAACSKTVSLALIVYSEVWPVHAIKEHQLPRVE